MTFSEGLGFAPFPSSQGGKVIPAVIPLQGLRVLRNCHRTYRTTFGSTDSRTALRQRTLSVQIGRERKEALPPLFTSPGTIPPYLPPTSESIPLTVASASTSNWPVRPRVLRLLRHREALGTPDSGGSSCLTGRRAPLPFHSPPPPPCCGFFLRLDTDSWTRTSLGPFRNAGLLLPSELRPSYSCVLGSFTQVTSQGIARWCPNPEQ